MTRTLAVDPGEERIGLAISDPSGTIARPLAVVHHQSRSVDAQRIAAAAQEHDVQRIVVGVALDRDGRAGPQARRALRLVAQLRQATTLEIATWDESGSTLQAQRMTHAAAPLDARAAAVILQEFLDAQQAR